MYTISTIVLARELTNMGILMHSQCTYDMVAADLVVTNARTM